MKNQRWMALAAAWALFAPASAQTVARVQVDVPALGAGVVGPPLAGPGAEAPGVFLPPSLPVPVLTPLPELVVAPQIPAAANVSAALLEVQGPQPEALKSLAELGATLNSRDGAPQKFEGAQKQLFDKEGDKRPVEASPAAPAFASFSPRLPPGVRSIAVHSVRTERDVDKFIPAGSNSNELIRHLKLNVKEMAPYSIYAYTDAFGQEFSAIDISAKPELIEIVPDLFDHERRLIMKIQRRNSDVQLLVCEKGKTPDLIVGGLVVELKSTKNMDHFRHLVEKANIQVLEHGQRHGLGHGAVAVDFWGYDQVPVSQTMASLDDFRRGAEAVVLDKIFVFAGRDLKVFVRQPDDSYLLETSGVPFGFWGGHARAIPDEKIKALERLTWHGWIKDAQRLLHKLESSTPGDRADLQAVRERIEGERVYIRVHRLMDRRNTAGARALWESFVRTHSSGIVEKLKPRFQEEFNRSKNPHSASKRRWRRRR